MGWKSGGLFPIGTYVPLTKGPETGIPNPGGEGILAENGNFLITENNEFLVTE